MIRRAHVLRSNSLMQPFFLVDSALLVLGVVLSALNAGRKYAVVSNKAGVMLTATVGWLSIATCLIWNTWWINKREGKRDVLLPRLDGRR